MDGNCQVKVYFLGTKVKEEEIKHNGQCNIVVKIKVSEKDMPNVLKG